MENFKKAVFESNTICKNCKYYKELILWNPMPDYKNISHCCTLVADDNRVHQINDEFSRCESWKLDAAFEEFFKDAGVLE